ncbi:Mg2+ and Co2+ transporter CorB, partial [Thermodesulfobacteriota bacterium]
LGQEAIQFFREKDLRELLKIHINDPESEIDKVEGKGALNFLSIDDLSIAEEGETIVPESIIEMTFFNNKPIFPKIEYSCEDSFLKRVHSGQKKWVVLTDKEGVPKLTLDSDAFLRSALFEKTVINPLEFCHRPIIIHDSETSLGDTILQLKVNPERSGDDVIDKDVILFWGDQKRVITGSDILGRLLRGIVKNKTTSISND